MSNTTTTTNIPARAWTGRGLARERWHGYLFLAPTLLFLAAVIVLPLFHAFWTSFQRIRGLNSTFVGFANYVRVLEDEAFWHSLRVSLGFVSISVVAHVVLGLLLALALNKITFARTALRVLFLTPWMVAAAVGATIWLWLLEPQFGVINYILQSAGLISAPVAWLGTPGTAFAAVTTVEIWRGVPFIMLLTLAGLQTIPAEQYESAEIDGATVWQRFVYVTFPYIRPTSVIITLLAAIWTFQNFDIIYLLTGGGPADATKILPTLVYEKGFWGLELGYASAISLLMLLCLTVLSVAYLFVYRAQREET
ncbi:MAG: sugar ABC transporter permease [Alphaproteobacteria bacterium]|nr:sugar ABC transporter permease [Alphaproteobacteria bacterium]